MSAEPSERWAELERLVREILALRRREIHLLEKLEAWLGSVASPTAAPASPQTPAPAEPPGPPP